jgi:hypothetical protein
MVASREAQYTHWIQKEIEDRHKTVLEKGGAAVKKKRPRCCNIEPCEMEKKPSKQTPASLTEHKSQIQCGQWAGMFNIKVAPERLRKPEAEILEEAAEKVARDCIRPQPRLPSPLNTKKCSLDGGLLPVVHCAFAECNWELTLAAMPVDSAQNNSPDIETTFREDVEHPCDQRLKWHILTVHKVHTPISHNY